MDKTSRECGDRRGLGEFLRSLLSGVPWSERAEDTETHRFAPPRGGALRVDNANGRTRIVGEDRDDIGEYRGGARGVGGGRPRCSARSASMRDEAGVLVIAFRSGAGTGGWVDVECAARAHRRGGRQRPVCVPACAAPCGSRQHDPHRGRSATSAATSNPR
jgi:hypothetical protein